MQPQTDRLNINCLQQILGLNIRQQKLGIRCTDGLYPIADISALAFLYGDGSPMLYGDLQEIIYGS